MIISCKCLNVTLDLGRVKPKGIPIAALKLTAMEESQKFFSEGVAEVDGIVGIIKNVPELTTLEAIGNWLIETCLNCSLSYFAKSRANENSGLISAGLVADPNTVIMLKSRPEYSPVFRILIKEPFFKISSQLEPAVVQAALAGLQQQFAQAVRKEAEKTDESIRSFTERQLDLLSKFRDRAVQDHDALVKLVCQAEATGRMEPEVEPQLTSPRTPTRSPANAQNFQPISRMRSQSLFCRGSAPVHDAEGVFSLDEIEESVEPLVSDAESDTDHDDSSSHDEGIDIHLKKTPMMNLAKSLPMNVPNFPAELKLKPVEFITDDERFQEQPPTDIAASIKALARSVHNDVFGDLPRPRFSSQI